jgi:hypothetical protein
VVIVAIGYNPLFLQKTEPQRHKEHQETIRQIHKIELLLSRFQANSRLRPLLLRALLVSVVVNRSKNTSTPFHGQHAQINRDRILEFKELCRVGRGRGGVREVLRI